MTIYIYIVKSDTHSQLLCYHVGSCHGLLDDLEYGLLEEYRADLFQYWKDVRGQERLLNWLTLWRMGLVKFEHPVFTLVLFLEVCVLPRPVLSDFRSLARVPKSHDTQM